MKYYILSPIVSSLAKPMYYPRGIPFFVLGDSHVRPFYPFFENYFYKNNLSGYFSGYSGCIPFLGVHALRPYQETRSCYELNLKVKEFIKNENIKYLVLISRWTYYTDGGYQGNLFSHIGKYQKTSPSKFNSREAFIIGLEKTLDQYFDLDVNVIVQNKDDLTSQLYMSQYL